MKDSNKQQLHLFLTITSEITQYIEIQTSISDETFDRDERSPKQKFIRFGRAGSARFIRDIGGAIFIEIGGLLFILWRILIDYCVRRVSSQ
uniref:Uncharacterized protein n=1 Tax=Parascaris equorum TaxID=6256 RepID=A0A914RD51_PAREQ